MLSPAPSSMRALSSLAHDAPHLLRSRTTRPSSSTARRQLQCRRAHGTKAGAGPLASAAYARDAAPTEATTSTPVDLTPAQRQLLERIVRVDQAGELAANWIYKGQLAAVKGKGQPKLAALIQVRRPGEPLIEHLLTHRAGDVGSGCGSGGRGSH